jgi:hypothetical protein
MKAVIVTKREREREGDGNARLKVHEMNTQREQSFNWIA